jgi:hypothetical protein
MSSKDPDDQPIILTRRQLKALMREAVTEVLLPLGVRADNPEAVLEMQRDFMHLREWRTSVEVIRKRGLLTVVTVLVTGLLGALWLGVKAFVQN